MKATIKITPSALKTYKEINNPYHDKIKEKIDELSEYDFNSRNIKPLKGEFKGLYRLRVGDYRIIFDKEETIITIISILHRKDVYN